MWLQLRALEALPPDRLMTEFVRLQLAPGVALPPRPRTRRRRGWPSGLGIRALIEAFDEGELDIEALRSFDPQAYFAVGGRSNPDYFARIAVRLAAIFPDLTIETYPERHHLDPPHRIEPERLSPRSLLTLWQRADP